MKKTWILAAAITGLLAGGVSAQQEEAYYTVDESSIMIERTGETEGVLPPPGREGGAASPLDNISKVVNLMEKLFDIMAKNQPVVEVSTKYANAVPADLKHWSQLQGWKRPSGRKYSFTALNALGGRVAKVDYQVRWIHGGSYRGRGQFLTGVTVEPISVTTVAGYKVSLAVEVPDLGVVNIGTEEDPVAAMQVHLRWTIHSGLKEIRQKAMYYVQGDGTMEEIGSPFENARAARRKAALERMTAASFD